jgi:hypothetical protein
LEALAAGCPVIASDKIPELPPCVTSATHEDLDEWVKAITGMPKLDSKDYVDSHSIVKINTNWQEFYSKLIEN